MIRRVGIGLTIALGLLAGCSSNKDQPNQIDIIKAYAGGILPKRAAAQQQPSDAQLAAALTKVLQSTSNPVILVRLETPLTTSAIVRIERNGAYDTYSTADKTAVIFKRGVLTGTRGMGNDLMSSDIDQSISKLTRRQSGETRRVMRYLDGQGGIAAITFTCQISAGETRQVRAGEINRSGRLMTEVCTGTKRTVTNTYVVASNGTILQSRQWLSPLRGYAVFQPLR